jgi:potassium efflux system protein
MPLRSLRSLVLGAVLVASAFGGAARAQEPPAPPPAAAPAAPIASAESRAARAKLDAYKAELDQKEAALQRPRLSGTELQALRQQIDPVAEGIREIVDDFGPRVDGAKARLDQLGPKPPEDAAPESSDVARERTAREAALADLGETQRLAKALLVQAEQLTTQISDRRRGAFARALLERTSGILSPDLWTAVVAALPREMRALRTVTQDWFTLIAARSSLPALMLVGLAIGVALALYIGRRHLLPRLVVRDAAAIDPSRRRRLLSALGVLAIGAAPAVAGSWVVYAALDVVGFLPPRIQPVVGAILSGLAFVAFVKALADALLAEDHAPWRVIDMSDAAAARTTHFAVGLSAVYAGGKALEALNTGIAAALPVSVATRGIAALACALVVAELLRRFAATTNEEEASLGPYVASEPEGGGPLRLLGWVAVAAILVAAVVGYVALASFLVDQLLWVGILFGALLLSLQLVDEFIGGTLSGRTRVATTLQANTGLRRRSLEQIGVLATGVARLALIVVAVVLALAPWGVDSADLAGSLRAAFFGVTIGGVTISLSTVGISCLVFALSLVVTRVIKGWLDTTFLPATDLDAGLRNSISTAFGYLGLFVAAALAFAYLGVSLDKIAIVAGALSVGIGFGLQSIVNNFVSGLILLWERPIRVGDLIVVGDGEGHVRRISVRATEIETFDRSTIIVPNSNLISGTVRNRVRGDRTGRVIVPVNVLRNTDPAHAAEILMRCASEHVDVLKDPAPRVFFKKIADANLEFELVCFVADVEFQTRVTSDLNFAVFACLTEAKIIPPLGPPAMDVKGLGGVETALDHIAQAIGSAAPPGSPGATRP